LLAAVPTGLVLALWAGPNLAVALPSAALASLSAATYAGWLLADRVRYPVGPPPVLVGDPVMTLRESFHSGSIGRQTIIQLIATMERNSGELAALSVTPEEEQQLLGGTAKQFRAWVDGRLRRLERET
jgi:hypothetical protein